MPLQCRSPPQSAPPESPSAQLTPHSAASSVRSAQRKKNGDVTADGGKWGFKDSAKRQSAGSQCMLAHLRRRALARKCAHLRARKNCACARASGYPSRFPLFAAPAAISAQSDGADGWGCAPHSVLRLHVAATLYQHLRHFQVPSLRRKVERRQSLLQSGREGGGQRRGRSAQAAAWGGRGRSVDGGGPPGQRPAGSRT